uniref:HAT C-terminal dimerisation domain-containing protein n=1 Tax=Panagrolaimus davidi TaxID=227884 RepID=A0A914QAP0_9BILA
MLNMYMSELMAIDSRFSYIAETEAFQAFVSFIKNLGFNVGRKFTNFSAPTDILPSPLNVKNSMLYEVHQLVKSFKDFLSKQSKFEYVIVLDHESLKNMYMGIVIVFINDWQLKYLILNVQDTEKINLNKIGHVKNVLLQFDLQICEHLVVCHQGMNLLDDLTDVGFSYCISETLKTVITKSVVLNNDVKKQVIFDKETVETLSVFQSIFEKIKNVIDLICKKPNLSELQSLQILFERRQKWISNVEMVESWLKIIEDDRGHLQKNFDNEDEIINFINDISNNHAYLHAFVTVLKPFQDKLQFLQCDYSPTVNHVLICFYELEDYLNRLKNSENVLVQALGVSTSTILDQMKIRFTKPIHYAACTMDIFQRAKIRQLRDASEVKKAKDETENLFVEYIKQITPTKDIKDRISPKIDDFAMCLDDELESNESSIIFAARNELTQYYRYIPSADLIAQKDVLLFWKSVTPQFPQLSKFASYILSIPASSKYIEKMCSPSTKIFANEKSLDSSMFSDLMLCRSLENFSFV